MKIKLHNPSVAIVVASVGLVLALGGGGTASGSGLSPGGAHSDETAPRAQVSKAGHRGKKRVRTGRIVDTDTTAHDDLYSLGRGRATCKRGEEIVTGGLQLRKGRADFIAGHFQLVESAPAPKTRQWVVTVSSDLGGAARDNFLVIVICRRR